MFVQETLLNKEIVGPPFEIQWGQNYVNNSPGGTRRLQTNIQGALFLRSRKNAKTWRIIERIGGLDLRFVNVCVVLHFSFWLYTGYKINTFLVFVIAPKTPSGLTLRNPVTAQMAPQITQVIQQWHQLLSFVVLRSRVRLLPQRPPEAPEAPEGFIFYDLG